jgi:class 3 adenylate cyclase/predicted ATPase
VTFEEILAQVRELLEREGRVAYRVLKRRFELNDEDLEDVKADLIDAKRVAMDEEGKVLVWAGTTVVSLQLSVDSSSNAVALQPPNTELRTQISSPQTLDPRRQTLDDAAERRQLTVMFCDLVGSTALSEQLDPEELRQVVQAYHQVSDEAIGRFDGQVAQHLGDGLLVYFGYPVAHEDDAQRAVRAGLAIVGAMQELPRRLNMQLPWPLQVRIGIHTGLVVVGEVGSGAKRELLALGETPNIAARLQGLAAPDAVVISGATYRLVQGLFECQDRGPQEVKGLSTPLSLYHVVRESAAQSRFEAAVTSGLTPLVGREQEVGLLRERWGRVKEGEGQVVLLNGEAGIGKSRLVQVLKEQLAEEPHSRLECHCSPYYQNSAFYPLIDLLQRMLQFKRDDSPEEKLRKLERALEPYGFALPEVVPLFASLLSVPLSDRYVPLTFTPQKQKEKTQQAVLAWLRKQSEKQALLWVWEDLQWIDPSTLEFLGLLINQGPTARTLTLLTFRPEFTLPWALRSHLTQLTLSRLPRKQIEAMVERVTGGKGLPVEVMQQVVSKTDGVPLFVEELTKMVLESGLLKKENGHYALSGPLPSLAIPATLQDALMARLDRLAAVREVAQLGATLGREFPYELIHAISPVEEAKLQEALAKLVEAEVLYQRGLPPQASYLFKHALIQETAYQSLLKSKRQQYHQQIAQILEGRFPETKETQPELLAHHYTEAGLIAQAIPYWQQAGEKATVRSAYVEAISHLIKGIELLKTLPDTPERTQQELALQFALGMALVTTKGFASPEGGNVIARARELCRQVGETPQLLGVLVGVVVFYLNRAELKTAHELAEQYLRLAQSVQDPYPLVWAHLLMGMPLFNLGEFVLAQEHLEQGMAFYDPLQHRVLAFRAGADPGTGTLSMGAFALWSLGYPDQALKRHREALTLAQEVSHPLSLANTLANAAWLHVLRREEQEIQERAEALVALCNEQGFAQYLASDPILRGWALAEQGQGEEGIEQIRQGMAAWQATGAELWRPFFLALLADSYGNVGQTEQGLATVIDALVQVEKTGERWYEAELYRLKGQLTLQQFQVPDSRFQQVDNPQSASRNPQLEAEECFLKAIEVARRQQAKSWELQAATSLSRLWQRQGKKNEARQLLGEIYGWFTEGFETKDLQEAKALLEELA